MARKNERNKGNDQNINTQANEKELDTGLEKTNKEQKERAMNRLNVFFYH